MCGQGNRKRVALILERHFCYLLLSMLLTLQHVACCPPRPPSWSFPCQQHAQDRVGTHTNTIARSLGTQMSFMLLQTLRLPSV